MTEFIVGLLLAVFIANLAYRARSLNPGGAVAAAFIGTVIFSMGGWKYGVLLLTFFITSSALSRAFKKYKQGLEKKYSKGDERDAGQVFGNGGIPALFAVLHLFFPHEAWPWLGFSASLAAVNADTWATEIGILNPSPPRLITDLGRSVEKGTSGGISIIGTLASLAGAALIGILAFVLEPFPYLPGALIFGALNTAFFTITTIAGFAGALFDSLVGATVQAIYFCPKDNKETEQHPTHSCGTPTARIRGWSWLDNDRVNVACGAFGAISSFLIQGFL